MSLPGPRDYERGQSPPELLVRDADDRVLGDIGMFGERVFQCTRIDILAARDDHVVFAADDVQPSRIVEVAHVAGAGHAVDDGFTSAAGVSVRSQFTADEDAAGDTRPDRPAVSVEDAHRASRDRSSDRLRGVT